MVEICVPSFSIGLLLGAGILFLASFHNQVVDRQTRNDVKKLMRAFSCGQGFVGCNGGLNAIWTTSSKDLGGPT